MNTQNSKLKDCILDQAKAGDIQMKPKSYFLLRSVLIGFGITVVFGLSMYLASFVLYTASRNGLWSLPQFGFRGYGLLFSNFPWILLLITVSFIILLEIFVKKYTSLYRRPLVYSALGVVVIIVVAGLITQELPTHQKLAKPLHNGFLMHDFDEVHPGVITEINKDTFLIKQPDGVVVLVATSTKTNFPRLQEFVVGDWVVVIGDIEDGILVAEGIHEPKVFKGPKHLRDPINTQPLPELRVQPNLR